jgi:hypothetical protein
VKKKVGRFVFFLRFDLEVSNKSENSFSFFEMDLINTALSLVLPSLYVGGLLLVFSLFQRWNTHRLLSASQRHKENPYFGRHITRDVYTDLSEQYPTP